MAETPDGGLVVGAGGPAIVGDRLLLALAAFDASGELRWQHVATNREIKGLVNEEHLNYGLLRYNGQHDMRLTADGGVRYVYVVNALPHPGMVCMLDVGRDGRGVVAQAVPVRDVFISSVVGVDGSRKFTVFGVDSCRGAISARGDMGGNLERVEKCSWASHREWCRFVIRSSDGGYLMGGAQPATPDLRHAEARDERTEKGQERAEFYVAKLGSDRRLQWRRSIAVRDVAVAKGAEEVRGGGFIISGRAFEWVRHGEQLGAAMPGWYLHRKEVFLVRLDGAGEVVWRERLPERDVICREAEGRTVLRGVAGVREVWPEGRAITETADGGFMFAGACSLVEGYMACVVKLDGSGRRVRSHIWPLGVAGTGHKGVRLESVLSTRDGGCVVAGPAYYTGMGALNRDVIGIYVAKLRNESSGAQE